ncbi:MAG: PilT/PilU family type 4a pilus ATPase [Candidatus Peribacteraceae bacterium]|nr:PilT/PilU family type 4a pilus ATPase [Candidatus Peribacteraceae bacterium]
MIQSTTSIWEEAVMQRASDLHVVVDYPVMLRIDGVLRPLNRTVMTAAQITGLLHTFLTDAQLERFGREQDLDCSFVIKDGTRFRINCSIVSGQPAFAARLIPGTVPSLKDLNMPSIVIELSRSRNGLLLFTGPTGTGKSTSLASLIGDRLSREALNVITLEDPVEFRIPAGKGIIQQRELGTDFHSFPEGLKHILRQDPDIVMVGEMRDLESIALALTLAETGHLVLATLHTPNAAQTIDRIIDVFPPHQQAQVRSQLSLMLRGIVAQRLMPKKGGGRIANREILVLNPAVSNIIRENRIAELPSVIQTSRDEGMITFEKDLQRLREEQWIEG